MNKFYLATVAAAVVTTSLATNILVAGTRVPAHPNPPTRARLAVRRWLRRFKHVVDAWVAAMIAHCERQAALYALHRMTDRDLRDIGLCRGSIDQIGHCSPPRMRRADVKVRR